MSCSAAVGPVYTAMCAARCGARWPLGQLGDVDFLPVQCLQEATSGGSPDASSMTSGGRPSAAAGAVHGAPYDVRDPAPPLLQACETAGCCPSAMEVLPARA